MPSPALPVPINARVDTACPVGDSLVRNGLFNYWRNTIHFNQRNAQYGVSAARASQGSAAGSVLMPWKTDGQSGTGIVHLAANVMTRIVANCPADPTKFVVLWLVSVNDLGLAVAQPGTGVWTTNATTVRNAIAANCPGCRVVLCGVLFNGEQTAAGPDWAATAANTQIAQLNSEAQAFAAASGYYWLDMRPELLAYEVANNPGQPPGLNTNVLTTNGDGVHLKPFTAGEEIVSAMMYAHAQVTV